MKSESVLGSEAVSGANTSQGALRERRRLRICMVAYSFYESDPRILQYASALTGRGDTVDVIALRPDGDLCPYNCHKGVNVYRIQARKVNETGIFSYVSRIVRFLLRATLFLARMHRAHPYDVIHVHNVPDFLVFAAVYPRWKGVPVILDIHDVLPELYASKFKIGHTSVLFKLLTMVERLSASFAAHVIVANHLWRDRLAARSSREDKCTVVRNYPDPDTFTIQTTQKTDQSSRFICIYPGSLNWHQGLDVAIQAFATVADQMNDTDFHIYGEGPAKPSLIELARKLGMLDRIFFHEFLPIWEIAKIMARADLAIEPKRATSAFGNEALSTKILEFMALGVPVIASRTRTHAYYYDDSIVKYYDSDNPAQLAAAMVLFRHSPLLRQEQARRAACYAAGNNWQTRKEDYLRLTDALSAAGAVPAVSVSRTSAASGLSTR